MRVGDIRLAVAAADVAEVIRGPRLTRVPHGPPGLLGVTHRRGQVVPIVSLSSLLGRRPEPVERVVVLNGARPVGLAVEAVESLKLDDDGQLGCGVASAMLSDADGSRPFDLAAALDERFNGTWRGKRGGAASFAPQALDRSAPRSSDLVLLTFLVAGQVYGIAIETVLAVDVAPAGIDALTRPDRVLLGVAPWREEEVAVVSMRALLGLGAEEGVGRAWMLVVRVKGQAVGLVVDQVSAIVRAGIDRLSPTPSFFNRDDAAARIDAVLRVPEANKLVSVVSVQTLLNDKRLAPVVEAEAGLRDQRSEPATSISGRERFIVVRLGAERYGFPIKAVAEVVRTPQTLSQLPRTPARIRGVMSIRGRIIPVIETWRRSSNPQDAAEDGRVVVLTIGALRAGFAVDAVDGLLDIETDKLPTIPDLGEAGAAAAGRVRMQDGEDVVLIDPKSFLDHIEADMLRDLAAVS